MKNNNQVEPKFIDVYAHIEKHKNNKTFKTKSIILFLSIFSICLIAALLIVCLIKFFA